MPPADPTAILQTPDAFRLRSWLRVPWDCLAMTGALLYWGILGLAVTLLALPFAVLLPAKTARRTGRLIHHLIFRCFVGYLRLTGLVKTDLRPLEKLAKTRGPVIVAPNHTSLWDAVFIIARLPQVVCVMKQSILCNPFLGGGARLAGYISNGSTSRMIRHAADAVSSGDQLLLFPEGTRTQPGARWINPLKGGCSLIAFRSGVPVHPVFIRSNTRFLQKGWPLWKRPHFPIHLEFDVGAPVTPLENESALEFTRRLQQLYEQELSKPHPLRRQIEDPGK